MSLIITREKVRAFVFETETPSEQLIKALAQPTYEALEVLNMLQESYIQYVDDEIDYATTVADILAFFTEKQLEGVTDMVNYKLRL